MQHSPLDDWWVGDSRTHRHSAWTEQVTCQVKLT